MNKQQEIIDFWFGELFADGMVAKEREAKWFKKNLKFDKEIEEKFKTDIERAAMGKYQAWRETPEGALALILLLDQFTRNVYRDSKKMFENDKLAREISKESIQKGFDRGLPTSKRQIMYMPLMHAEDKSLQSECVNLLTELHDQVVNHMKERVALTLEYAKRHLDIINRFGRFPHRNEILKRESTPEEIEFLNEPDSSF